MPSPTAATTTLIQTPHHSLTGSGVGTQSETITLLPGAVPKHGNNVNSLTPHSGGRGTPPQQSVGAHYTPHQQQTPANAAGGLLPGSHSSSPGGGVSHMSISQVRIIFSSRVRPR